jgi:hypothetical protein
MTRSPDIGATLVGGLVGAICLIVGLVPVVFLEATRRAGSIGKLNSLGLLVMAAVVAVIATLAGRMLYRVTIAGNTHRADVWVAAFIALTTWGVAVLTLVPGLVFLRLSDNRSLDDYGARFFLEWALVYLMIAAAAIAFGRWTLRSLAKAPEFTVGD